jgi:16S rRNA G1207 methylase RsmC
VVAPSLGYRDLPAGHAPFDWILSNVPARAGERVLGAFIAGGLARLRPGGEMRIVVIAPLAPSVERAAADAGLEFRLAARSGSHCVYAFAAAGVGRSADGPGDGEELYERDCIRLSLPETLRLVRPSDLADEPGRLQAAIPLLADRLPALSGARVLVFRAGYGLLAALALARCPGSAVTAVDRDLLAGAFARKNCRGSEPRIRVVERLRITDGPSLGPFDLILGELSPPLGPRATLSELADARNALAPGGRGLVLALAKQWKEFLERSSADLGLRLLAARSTAVLLELRGGSP